MSKRKNIIFYFSDQQRYDTFNSDVMPFLSDLSKGGTIFDNAYTCQPVCGPARSCLQTGLYASENGCFKNDIALKIDAVTIAKLLTENGYDTAYIGKWHLASGGEAGNNRTKATPKVLRGGYRYWRAADCLEFTSNGYGGYIFDGDGNKITFDKNRADAINDFALEYLDKGRDKDKPFFMFVSQLEPHHQNSTDTYQCPKGYGEQFKDMPIPNDLKAFNGNYEKRYADYLGCIRSLDENLARLFDKLNELGLVENTVVIYTSDHGCHFKTRNLEYKRSCHDSSTHIPMTAIGGEFNGKGRYDGLVSLIDIPPTILNIAGIDVPESFRGKPLGTYLNGTNKRDNVYLEISESQLGRAIITNEFTYSVRKLCSLGLNSGRAKTYVEDKLYDNIHDPDQLENLINNSRFKEVRNKLRKMLLDEIEKVEGKRPSIRRKLFRSNKD